jgi:hypothetical protein
MCREEREIQSNVENGYNLIEKIERIAIDVC